MSAVAAFRGNPALAVGNAIGSNIANIGLILGLTAVVYPLRVESETLRREYPVLILIMVGSFIMAADLQYNRTEGWLLLFGLVALVVWMVRFGLRRAPDDPLAAEYAAEIPRDMPTGYAVFWMLVGLVILPMSSRFLVEGAIYVARTLEVSEAVIGLTIVALGTSLPELAAALTSALRNEDDLAIGHVIGPNMFNIPGVLGGGGQSDRNRAADAVAGFSGEVPVHRAAGLHGLRHQRARPHLATIGGTAAEPVPGLPGAGLGHRLAPAADARAVNRPGGSACGGCIGP